ncbi:MAG TPA: TerC family protein [Trueperaceae bacterium]
MEWITSPEAWIALLTLTVLEIVLGIDNIIFISILSGKLPEHQQGRARTLGLALAMFTRIALLFSISWLASLTTELFELWGHGFTGRDLVFLAGGLFLIWKATAEIHERLEGPGREETGLPKGTVTFAAVITQIVLLDIVFSIDSVVTAVGMADHLPVMIAAVVIAVGVMMLAAGPVSHFVESHPTVKMLALAFLIMIGISLLADGLGQHIPKGYIYFAMAFSVAVEFLNQRAARAARAGPRQPVELKKPRPPVRSAGD